MSGQIDHYHSAHGVEPVMCLFDPEDFPMAMKKRPARKVRPGPSAEAYFSDSSSFSSKGSSSKASSRITKALTPHNSNESTDSSDEEITLGTPARSRANSEESAQVHSFSIKLEDLQAHMAHCLSTAPKPIKAKKQAPKQAENAIVPWGTYAVEEI